MTLGECQGYFTSQNVTSRATVQHFINNIADGARSL